MPVSLQVDIIKEYLERQYKQLRTRKLGVCLRYPVEYVDGNLVIRYPTGRLPGNETTLRVYNCRRLYENHGRRNRRQREQYVRH
jgi:hypothetical protein